MRIKGMMKYRFNPLFCNTSFRALKGARNPSFKYPSARIFFVSPCNSTWICQPSPNRHSTGSPLEDFIRDRFPHCSLPLVRFRRRALPVTLRAPQVPVFVKFPGQRFYDLSHYQGFAFGTMFGYKFVIPLHVVIHDKPP